MAFVSNWRKYVHEVLVNRLGGLSLPRKSVVRLTDRPDMTLGVYRGHKTTLQQQYNNHNLIKKKLINLNETTFHREGTFDVACDDKIALFTSDDQKRFKLWSCQNVCDALIHLLDNIFIRFGPTLGRQIVETPIGTNFAPLIALLADLFLSCYDRDLI